MPKCAEIIFEHGKIVGEEGLQVLEERMKTMDQIKKKSINFWELNMLMVCERKQCFKD